MTFKRSALGSPAVSARSMILLLAFLFATGCSHPRNSKLTDEEKARLYIEAANASLNEGDPTTALQQIMTAERFDANLPEEHHTKALIFVAKHDLGTAIIEARKAVQLDPKFSAANNTLGKLLMDIGRPDEAIKPLQTSAQDPLYAEAYKPWTNLGILFYRRMDWAQANHDFNRAIEESPQAACIAYYYRGHIALQRGKLRSAIEDYELASKRYCAGFAEAHLALGIAYEREKQYDRARKIYLEIQDRFGSSHVAEQAMNHLKYLP